MKRWKFSVEPVAGTLVILPRIANPAGLGALPLQDFDGNSVTFSLRYAF